VLCILSCSTFDEAIDIANDVPYGLSSAIYTRELREAFEAANRLEAGITVVNNPPGSVETHLPFGGVKDSGIGREGGIEGIDEFSWIQTVYIDY
jgi:aldehyde dehydrogenase (NAD+)